MVIGKIDKLQHVSFIPYLLVICLNFALLHFHQSDLTGNTQSI